MSRIFDSIENGMTMLETALLSRVPARKMEEAKELLADINYCLRHMEESAFGRDFLSNLLIAVGAQDGEYAKLSDYIVRNTQREVVNRMRALMTGKKVKDLECTDVRDTMLPGSNWIYRGYCRFMRRCRHDYTVHFKCGKNGNVPKFDEVATMFEELIEDSEN